MSNLEPTPTRPRRNLLPESFYCSLPLLWVDGRSLLPVGDLSDSDRLSARREALPLQEELSKAQWHVIQLLSDQQLALQLHVEAVAHLSTRGPPIPPSPTSFTVSVPYRPKRVRPPICCQFSWLSIHHRLGIWGTPFEICCGIWRGPAGKEGREEKYKRSRQEA